jgi:hypothetical protein
VTPSSITASLSGGSGSLTITTAPGCSWTTTSTVPWISLVGAGSASGSATYFVSGNSAAAARTGTITVAGQAVTFTQAGTSLPPLPPRGLRILRK